MYIYTSEDGDGWWSTVDTDRNNTHSYSRFTYRQDHCFLNTDWPITRLSPWQLRVHTRHLANHQLHGKLKPQQEKQTFQLLNFQKTQSVLKMQIKGAKNLWRKCYIFPQNITATLYFMTQLSEKQILNSCLQTMRSVAAWRSAWSSTTGPQRPLPMPRVLREHVLQQAEKISALRWGKAGFCVKASLLLFELRLGTRTGPWINYARIYAQS